MEHQFYLVSVFRGSRPGEAAGAEQAVGARSSVLRNLTSPLPGVASSCTDCESMEKFGNLHPKGKSHRTNQKSSFSNIVTLRYIYLQYLVAYRRNPRGSNFLNIAVPFRMK